VVLDRVQLPVRPASPIVKILHQPLVFRFPLDIVFRIYDSLLANGIEAIFSFSIQLLRKNEDSLLKMKFDEILAFLNGKLLDAYKVPYPHLHFCFSTHQTTPQLSSNGDDEKPLYNTNALVQESVSVPITPFMLDCYRHEYEDLMVRIYTPSPAPNLTLALSPFVHIYSPCFCSGKRTSTIKWSTICAIQIGS
jgi:hypothetical protein